MKVHRNKCPYRGRSFAEVVPTRIGRGSCSCFDGAPVPIAVDPRIDYRRNINVYWTSLRRTGSYEGPYAVFGGSGTSAPEKMHHWKNETGLQLWLTNNVTRAKELAKADPATRAEINRLNASVGVDQCRIRGPYLPTGRTDWECETHSRELVRRAGRDVCPVTGQAKGDRIPMPTTARGGIRYGSTNPDPILQYKWRKTNTSNSGKLHVVHNGFALCSYADKDLHATVEASGTLPHDGRCKRCLHYIGAPGGAIPMGWAAKVPLPPASIPPGHYEVTVASVTEDPLGIKVELTTPTTTKKESEMRLDMNNREQRAASLRSEAERLLVKAAELEARPDEPEADEDGTATVTVTVQFPGSDREYTYAAVRATNGLWYSTGDAFGHSGVSWERLIDWFFDNCQAVTVWQAVAHEVIGEKR